MSRIVLVVVFLAGCSSEVRWPGGTGVGNPGTTKVGTASSATVMLRSGSGRLVGFTVDRCERRPADFPVDQDVDLLGTEVYELAGGPWCALTTTFAPPLVFDGVAGDGTNPDAGTFELVLDVDAVALGINPEIEVDGDAFVLELGHWDWISSDLLGPLADHSSLLVDATHPAYDALVTALVGGSALYLDADGDGTLSPSERRDPVAAGDGWRHDVEDDR